MLTIASDHEFDERNEKIRTSPTPLPGASNFPSVRKSTEVTLILHQQRRFVRGQSTHLRSDGLIKKKGFTSLVRRSHILLQYHHGMRTPLKVSALPALLHARGRSRFLYHA